MRVIFVIFLLVGLGACSTTGNKKSAVQSGLFGSADEGVPVETVPAPVETQILYIKPVVKRLLKKAQQKIDNKYYHAAVMLLEQAIDISPNNPFAWQRLAIVRLRQHNYSQAEQLAIKSNVLGEMNDELRMLNWQIIAEAKRGQTSH